MEMNGEVLLLLWVNKVIKQLSDGEPQQLMKLYQTYLKKLQLKMKKVSGVLMQFGWEIPILLLLIVCNQLHLDFKIFSSMLIQLHRQLFQNKLKMICMSHTLWWLEEEWFCYVNKDTTIWLEHILLMELMLVMTTILIYKSWHSLILSNQELSRLWIDPIFIKISSLLLTSNYTWEICICLTITLELLYSI